MIYSPVKIQFRYGRKQARACYLHYFCAFWLYASQSLAAPLGAHDSFGVANVAQEGKITEIQQFSERGVVNWDSFDVAGDEVVRFVQPSESSWTLNRVHDSKASEIFGKVEANGSLAFVNKHGVVFHEGSRVDVHSIIASSSDIKDSEFLAGKMHFGQSGLVDAEIQLNGRIDLAKHGLGAFVAPNLTQNGEIYGKLSKITLATGDKWRLDMGGLVKLEPAPELVQKLMQSGKIKNNGGLIKFDVATAKKLVRSVINIEGELEATKISQHNGKIRLRSHDTATLSQKSKLKATNIAISGKTLNANGSLQAEDSIKIKADRIDSTSKAKMQAKQIHQVATKGTFSGATYEADDKILLSGNTALLNAKLDAPTVAIGAASTYKKAPTVKINSLLTSAEATKLYIAPGTTINANTALLWSQNKLDFYGQAKANTLEISAPNLNLINPADNLAANNLILDPTNIVITNTYPTPTLSVQMGLGVTTPTASTLLSLTNTDNFGTSVSLNAAGNILAVGADMDDMGGGETGAVYIFSINTDNLNSNTEVIYGQKIGDGTDGANLNSNIRFGADVSLNAAGNILAVGADRDPTGGSRRGAVFLFSIDETDVTNDGATVFGHQIAHGAVGLTLDFWDSFGIAVGLNATGDILAIGAHNDDHGGFNRGAAYVFEIDETDVTNIGGTSIGQRIRHGTDGLSLIDIDFFGSAVSFNETGNILAIGSMWNNVVGSRRGAAYIFNIDETDPSNSAATVYGQRISHGTAGLSLSDQDRFGKSLSLNSTGNILAVGAYNDDIGGGNRGAVYIFNIDENDITNTGATVLGQTIAHGSSNISLTDSDFFGSGVALNGAGDMLVIGSENDDDGGSNKGSAYIFNIDPTDITNTNGTIYRQKISEGCCGNPTVGDFGHSIALNSAGDIMAVSVFEDGASVGNGSVYLYNIDVDNPSGVTTYENRINALNGGGVTIEENEAFGSSVALNDDGDVMAVGATGASYGTQRGAVYLLTLGNLSTKYAPSFNYRLDDQLAGLSLTEHDSFGYSIALNGSADLIVVGDPYDSTNGADAGAVHSFSLDGTLTPTHLNTAHHATAGDEFGHSVALNSAGDILAVGAPMDDTNVGAVHVHSVAAGVPTLQQSIDGTHPDLTLVASKYFGSSVALNDTGSLLAVGSSTTQTGDSAEVAADVFSLNVNNLTSKAEHNFTIDNGHDSLSVLSADGFARSLALNGIGDVLVIGSPKDDDLGADAGAVYYMSLTNYLDMRNTYGAGTFFILTQDIENIINAGSDLTLQADNNIDIASDLNLAGTSMLTLNAGNNITNSSGRISGAHINFIASGDATADLDIKRLTLNLGSSNFTGRITGSVHANGANFKNNSSVSPTNLLFNGRPLQKFFLRPTQKTLEEIAEDSSFNYEPYRARIKKTSERLFSLEEIYRERLNPIYAFTQTPKRVMLNLDRFLQKRFLSLDLDFHPFKETTALDAWIPIYEAYWSFILGRNVVVRNF